MEKMLLLFLILFNNFCLVYGQSNKDYSITVPFELIVKQEKNADTILHKLDSFQAQFPPFKKGIVTSFWELGNTIDYLNREIDYEVSHKRIILNLINFDLKGYYNIDLIIKNKTILLTLVTSELYDKAKPQVYIHNQEALDKFIKKRNVFYQANKTFDDLVSEIILTNSFAFYCGDASPLTRRGKRIKRLVNLRRIDKLGKMLKSFSPERQAYGVAGFDMLKKKITKRIPRKYKKLIKYIKNRNSEVMTCAGCFDGMVRKIY